MVLLVTVVPAALAAQDGPRLPVVLDHADSVVGVGPLEGGVRQFYGAVRFRQGNVTVTCDRAVHDVGRNRVDLYGRVVVRQGTMEMSAPSMTYDGETLQAEATSGVVIRDGGRTVTARRGTYSTETHVARFRSDVRVDDDTTVVEADSLVYDRSSTRSDAFGSVRITDRLGRSRVHGDTALNDPAAGYMRVVGHGRAWRLDPRQGTVAADSTARDSSDASRAALDDTTYVEADTLQVWRGPVSRQVANGHAVFVRRDVAARADTIVYDQDVGSADLFGTPVLWAEASQLVADSITITLPERKLRTITGRGNAMLVRRSDTTYPDRFDQVAGRRIDIAVERDTMRRLVATDDTRSIYWRIEEGRGEGLAQFSSDTTTVLFEAGVPEDILWLGGVHGEQHPESVVAGRSTTYRLPGFQWHEERPAAEPMPATDVVPADARPGGGRRNPAPR